MDGNVVMSFHMYLLLSLFPVVFIGANLDEKGIREALDSCLCTDEQMDEYKQAILDAIAEYYAEQGTQ